jgi:two-component system OmpR family sensor kinase
VNRLPIRIRLTLVFAVVMAVVLAALGTFLYVRLGSSLDERIADELESRSAAVAALVRAGEAAGVEPSLLRGEEGVVQVIGPDGTAVFPSGDPVLRAEELEAARRALLTLERDGFRLQADPVGDSVVVVGESLEDRDEALAALLTQLLVALPLALLASSSIGYLVAGAALRPVEEMRVEAEAISASEPGRRLPLPAARDEIHRLGVTLNEMLDRLGSALERERSFVADASHELRTPLALLKAELELATRQPRTTDELERALNSAAEETDRLVRLSEDLLLVARVDREKLALQPTRVRAAELLADVSRRFDVPAGAEGREIAVEASPELVFEGDADRLAQALGNMVENALRHGAGSILLRAHVRDGVVELHVMDEGGGFPPEFVARAFERFSRAAAARGDGGTGLGLAIVEAIARAHGGAAHAANRDGRGADVWISIPRLNGNHASRRDRRDIG